MNLILSSTYICENKYKIFWSKILGKGLTSIVYEGIEIDTNNKVAIKIMEKKNKLKKFFTYLNNEIEILNILNKFETDNLIRLYKTWEDTINFYLIFEFVPNKFYNLIHNIEEDKVFFYLKQLLNSLILLQQNNIIHNDIKPANILLSDNNRLKICDFGMSIILNHTDFTSGSVCGSPLYMDLNKFNGIHSYKSDFWSLKLIYYEMVYHKHIFDSVKNTTELKEKLNKFSINFPKEIKFHTNLLRKLFQEEIITSNELLKEIEIIEIKQKEEEKEKEKEKEKTELELIDKTEKTDKTEIELIDKTDKTELELIDKTEKTEKTEKTDKTESELDSIINITINNSISYYQTLDDDIFDSNDFILI